MRDAANVDGVGAETEAPIQRPPYSANGVTAAKDRRYAIKSALRPAMQALRDAEDMVRLDLRDEVLADRIRGVHEALTADVLNGNSHRLPDRWKAKMWDRYCLLRGHDPDAGARNRFVFLRRLGYRKVAA